MIVGTFRWASLASLLIVALLPLLLRAWREGATDSGDGERGMINSDWRSSVMD